MTGPCTSSCQQQYESTEMCIPLQIRVAMQCMQDRKNIGKILLSPLKAPPQPPEPEQPKEQPKQAEEPKAGSTAKQEEKTDEKVSSGVGIKHE